ncbi:MAG: DUF411 domain-containing protein [Gemmatimonadales bacterium]
MISRRGFVALAAGLALPLSVARRLRAGAAPAGGTPITVYKGASCGCCVKWVDHLREAGFEPTSHDEEDLDRIKDRLGIPQPLRSCHTAQVDGYLVEGHVPAADVRKLITLKPRVAGLAVPGMPASSPGMAVPGAPHQPFEVLSFQTDGSTRVYARH